MKKAKPDPYFASKNPSILKRDASQAENVCEPEKIKRACLLDPKINIHLFSIVYCPSTGIRCQ